MDPNVARWLVDSTAVRWLVDLMARWLAAPSADHNEAPWLADLSVARNVVACSAAVDPPAAVRPPVAAAGPVRRPQAPDQDGAPLAPRIAVLRPAIGEAPETRMTKRQALGDPVQTAEAVVPALRQRGDRRPTPRVADLLKVADHRHEVVDLTPAPDRGDVAQEPKADQAPAADHLGPAVPEQKGDRARDADLGVLVPAQEADPNAASGPW